MQHVFSFDATVHHALYSFFMKLLSQYAIKKAVAEKAATLVEEGMLVGLGTGSTSHCFIEN